LSDALRRGASDGGLVRGASGGGHGRDQLGPVFAALADPTRRSMLEALLRDGTTTVPTLTASLPITRQAVAKHLSMLDHAGLIERAPTAGREVRYRLRNGALAPATAWLRDAEVAWDQRLARLKDAVERRR
jgi:ArsR family transcriptional regulator, cadmium/lead-responsive transcriptional repressor